MLQQINFEEYKDYGKDDMLRPAICLYNQNNYQISMSNIFFISYIAQRQIVVSMLPYLQ